MGSLLKRSMFGFLMEPLDPHGKEEVRSIPVMFAKGVPIISSMHVRPRRHHVQHIRASSQSCRMGADFTWALYLSFW